MTNRQKKTSRLSGLIQILLVLLLIGSGILIGYNVMLIKSTPPLNLEAITNMPSATHVYDRKGKLLGYLQKDGIRDPINHLAEISPLICQAFIAAEDNRFYSHHGFDLLAILRASIQNLVGQKIVSGASTITQQMIKNAYFPEQKRTLERKIQETVLAIRLENRMSKDEILMNYLNWIYFGKSGDHNLYGIHAASRGFFGKTAKELNLAEAAFLAAIPNNPSLYDPSSHLENTLARQRRILEKMKENRFINQQDYEEALSFDIRKSLHHNTQNTQTKHPYLLSEIEQRAAEALLHSGRYSSLYEARQGLSRDGLKVYTTIDSQMQRDMQKVIENPAMYPEAKEQAGAILIDNKTGGILAVGAGRDYSANQNNHTLLPRQPGSAMKPLAIFAPAIEKHLVFPGTVIDDVPTLWPDPSEKDGKYFPLNWDKKFHGLISIREAFSQSYNVPALKVFEKLTPAVGLAYVKKMGITSLQPEDFHLAAGIGGMSQGITVEEATSAYTTFPNNGIWKDSFLIEKIVDRNNQILYEYKPQTQQVFSPLTAYIVTDMMKDVVQKGTANMVGKHFPGRAIAGKTGTTNDDKDAWFIGFTPHVTLGIWVGYDLPSPLKNGESRRPQVLWNQIMDDVYKDLGKELQFSNPPQGIVRVEISRFSGKKPSPLVRQINGVTSDLFIRGFEPQEMDDVLIKAKVIEIEGKKYRVNTQIPYRNVKEHFFIKRQPYLLPHNDLSYRPLDAHMEVPTEWLAINEATDTTQKPKD